MLYQLIIPLTSSQLSDWYKRGISFRPADAARRMYPATGPHAQSSRPPQADPKRPRCDQNQSNYRRRPPPPHRVVQCSTNPLPGNHPARPGGRTGNHPMSRYFARQSARVWFRRQTCLLQMGLKCRKLKAACFVPQTKYRKTESDNQQERK